MAFNLSFETVNKSSHRYHFLCLNFKIFILTIDASLLNNDLVLQKVPKIRTFCSVKKLIVIWKIVKWRKRHLALSNPIAFLWLLWVFSAQIKKPTSCLAFALDSFTESQFDQLWAGSQLPTADTANEKQTRPLRRIKIET